MNVVAALIVILGPLKGASITLLCNQRDGLFFAAKAVILYEKAEPQRDS